MRKILFIAIPTLLSTNTYGQEKNDLTKYQDTVFIKADKDWSDDTLTYAIDTIIFETGRGRPILIGTTVLPWTQNQQGAKNYGVYFDKVIKSDCQKEVTEYGGEIENHINSITTTDTTLTIDFNIFENCCYSFLCDISVDSTATLNLIYTGYGTWCFCDCCFGLTYHLTIMKGIDIPKIKAVMIMGNRKTLKEVKL